MKRTLIEIKVKGNGMILKEDPPEWRQANEMFTKDEKIRTSSLSIGIGIFWDGSLEIWTSQRDTKNIRKKSIRTLDGTIRKELW